MPRHTVSTVRLATLVLPSPIRAQASEAAIRTRAALGVLMILLALASPARAQSTSAQPGFLAMDAFGAFSAIGSTADDEPGRMSTGWTAGGTLRLKPWLGFKGEVARTSLDTARHTQMLGGVEVLDPYGYMGVREFAHVLVGRIGERPPTGNPVSSPELVVGAGFDFYYIFRLQLDYALLDLPGRPRHNLRVHAGAVVPLCFRGCRPTDTDGIPVRRRRR